MKFQLTRAIILSLFIVFQVSAPVHSADSTTGADTRASSGPGSSASAVSRLLAYGWQSYNEGNLKDARFFFKKALELSPNSPDALYGLSWTNFKEKRFDEAAKGFEKLLARGFKERESGRALFFIMVETGKRDEARRYLSYFSPEERKKYQALVSAPKKVSRRKGHKRARSSASARYVKRRQAAQRPEKTGKTPLSQFFRYSAKKRWQKVIELYGSLPEDVRERDDVKKVAAWAYFNTGNFKGAKVLFEGLLRGDKANEEVLEGLALSCSRLGDYQCLHGLARKMPENPSIKRLACELARSRISTSYSEEKYKEAASQYALFEDMGCRDEKGEIAALAAWSHFKAGEYSQSERLFRFLIRGKRANRGVYQGLVASLEAQGKKGQLWEEMDLLARSSWQEGKEIAGDFFFKKGYPQRAAWIWKDDSAPYYNADSPSLKMAYGYTYVEGDRGTSRLEVQEMPGVELRIQPQEKIGLGLGLSHLLVQSGAISKGAWLGSPFLGTFSHKAESSVKAAVPRLFFEYQGRVHLSGQLSSTPAGTGLAGAVPLFSLKAEGPGEGLGLSIFQRSVTRSLLSFVGQRDPYTGKIWGRVVATGASAHGTVNFKHRYWASFKGSYSHLWGKDTWHNNEVSGGISVGRSLDTTFLEDLSLGIYTFLQHFKRNSNFYTFGHGGYFSPQFFLAAGPFIHATSRQGSRWLATLDASLSYLNYYEEASPFYPISGKNIGSYSSNQTSKLGYSMKFSSGYLFTSRVMGGLNFAMDKSGDFSQWHIGVTITFFFQPRKGLLRSDLGSLSKILSN
ncbi:MAG: tetratricopeptide repeat protein [Thermodesulfobacteria bacterium]|nr:tetratricopeptide repeat protein [Thermodesulfobacteriota bacterium]